MLVNRDEDGYRTAESYDDLWYVVIELSGRRCPFPFAINCEDEGDVVPSWLTDEVRQSAIAEARAIGAKMHGYAIPETPPEAIEFLVG